MKKLNNRFILLSAVVICISLIFTACAGKTEKAPVEVDVLILPHFENGEMAGDFPGEAQCFYEHYLKENEKFELKGGNILLYNRKNHVAMCVTGAGKVNTATALTSALSDTRFDFSNVYIVGVGCCGGAIEYMTLGDVCLATAVCDNDLGHTGDPREMDERTESKWYHDPSYDDVSYKVFNKDIVSEIYEHTKDVKLQTTELSRRIMKNNFGNAEWAVRDPRLILGTCITSDNYWKGLYDHDKAIDICEHYGTEYPYAVTEMEDIAIADVAEKFGMLDRTIVLRASVNTDVFLDGRTPETTWGGDETFHELIEEDNVETLDIFEPAMWNLFSVGSAAIDYLLGK